VAFSNIYNGKTVFITGHTGFKGAWLVQWLKMLGANIVGYSLAPPTNPSLFNLTNGHKDITHIEADIRDYDMLQKNMTEVQPDFVIHMAAQSLVRYSYDHPLETIQTNIIGTANVLESLKTINHKCACVVVTSDKCYENKEQIYGYREDAPMGGSDPYSMSKGAAELLTSSWQRSFFSGDSHIKLGSARAGNVVGGGDWATDRIVTDSISALLNGEPIKIRNPHAVRPWQHVLEPLSGYLWLAAELYRDEKTGLASGWNFGPDLNSLKTVEEFVNVLLAAWGSGEFIFSQNTKTPLEAQLLSLSIEKAQHHLGWKPVWDLRNCLDKTANWYKAWQAKDLDLSEFTQSQIREYSAAAARKNVDWVVG